MADAREMVLLIKADPSGMKAGLDQSQSLLDKMVGGLGKVGLAGLGIGAIAGGAKAAAEGLLGLVGSSEGLADSQNRVNLVFAQSAKGISDWAANNANAFGLSKQAALDAAGGLGQYLVNMGLTDTKAADMSKTTVELAAKLGAFTGKSTEEAMNAIQKGLGGATRGLKEMGVSINTDLLKGLDKAGQASAIYDQILAQTANAQKAWADNSGDVDVSMQRVSAAVENAKAAIGDRLLPAIAPLAEQFASLLPGAIDTAMGVFSGLMTLLGPLADWLGNSLPGAISGGVDLITSVVGDLKSAWESDWGGIRSAAEAVVKWWDSNVAPAISKAVDIIKSAVSGLATEWETNWSGKIEPAVRGFIDWWQANVAPTIESVANNIRAVLGGVAQFFVDHWAEISSAVSGSLAFIGGLIDTGMAIIKGVVTAALALLRGDWRGAWDAIVEMVRGVGAGVEKALGGLWTTIKSVGTLALNKAKEIGGNIVSGIKSGIDNAWATFSTWVHDQIMKIPEVVRKALGIASPSKVFEQIGMYIAMGLAAGLDKYDVKAVEAMQKVVASITGVMSNIPNFFKSLKEMVIPSDSDLSDMRSKFESVVDIMERFVKSMALRSVAIGVGDSSMIPQNIVDSIKAAGLDPGQLISGGDVGNVGGMMDILGKVAGSWKGIADSLTAIASIKIPDTSRLDAVKAAAWSLVQFAESVANDMPAVPEFGAVADLLTDAVKGVGAVVKLDLSDFKPVDLAAFRGVLSQVGSMMLALQTLASNLTGGMALDEAGRKAIDAAAANAKAYFGAISDIAKSVGDVADLGSRLSEIKAMSFDSLGSLELIITLLASIGANLTSGLRGLDPNRLKDDYANLKEYFGAVSEIAKTLGDVGELGAKLKDATLATADQIAIAGENARLAFERGDVLSLAFRALADQGKVIADSVKNWTSAAGDSVKLLIDSVGLGEKTKDATAVLYTNLLTAADNAAQALGVVRLYTSDWEGLADQGKSLSEAVKNWADSAGKAVDLLLKASGLGEALGKATAVSSVRLRFVRMNIVEVVGALRDIIADLEGRGYTEALITTMSKWTDGLGKIYDLFAKAGGVTVDWSKVSTISSVRFRFIRENIAGITAEMKALYDDLTAKGFTSDVLTAIGTWASAVAGIVSSFGGMVGSLEKLAGSKGGAIGQGVVDQAIENIRAVVTAFSGSNISAEASSAAKALAEAAGPALDVLGKALEVLSPEKMMGGFFARSYKSGVMSNAAKTWAKNYAESVKSGIQLMLQTLSDVFEGAGAPKPPSEATANAIAAMVKAYDPLIDLISKIAGMNVDLKKFSTVMAAAAMLQAGMAGMPPAGGGGPAGTGGGQGSPPGSGGAGATPFSAPGTLKIDKLEIANQVNIDSEAVAEIVTSKGFQQAVQLYYALKPGAA